MKRNGRRSGAPWLLRPPNASRRRDPCLRANASRRRDPKGDEPAIDQKAAAGIRRGRRRRLEVTRGRSSTTQAAQTRAHQNSQSEMPYFSLLCSSVPLPVASLSSRSLGRKETKIAVVASLLLPWDLLDGTQVQMCSSSFPLSRLFLPNPGSTRLLNKVCRGDWISSMAQVGGKVGDAADRALVVATMRQEVVFSCCKTMKMGAMELLKSAVIWHMSLSWRHMLKAFRCLRDIKSR